MSGFWDPVLQRLDQASRVTSIRLGTVTDIDPVSLSLTLDIAGDTITDVRWIDSYEPVDGDFVTVVRADGAWVVLGKLSKNLTGPGYAPGAMTVEPINNTYAVRERSSGVWQWDDSPGESDRYIQQGASNSWSGRAGYLWYPPLASVLPDGATVTAARLQLKRSSTTEQPALAVPRLYRHTLASPPSSGAPSGLTGGVWSPGSVARGEAAAWALPSAWLTDLLAGTVRGIATYSLSAADLSHWRSGSGQVNGLIFLDYTVPA